jgi:hypothetical protein
MGYPTASDLVGESQVPELTSLSTTQQNWLYEASVAAVEEYCGQKFDFQPGVTMTLDGSGTDTLYLPKRLEVFTDITVIDSGLETADMIIGPDNDTILVKRHAYSLGNYYTRTLRDLSGALPLLFTWGPDTVTITGDWGWASFPDQVRTALRKDMEDTALADANMLSSTIRSYRKLGLRDIAQGNLRATIAGSPGLGDEVLMLLRPFIWRGAIGALA